MKFLADEGADAAIVVLLREKGYNVLYIAEINPSILDSEVLSISVAKNAILITEDKDFGELVYRLKQVHCGVILIRLHGKKSQEKAEIVLSVIQNHKDELTSAFTVIYEDFVKIRR